MNNLCESFRVQSKKFIKRCNTISLIVLAFLMCYQQVNIASILNLINGKAQGFLLTADRNSIYEGDEIALTLARSTEEVETIEFTLPDGMILDVSPTEINFSDTTEFTYDKETNHVKISYAEGDSDKEVKIYISCAKAGRYIIPVTSTNGDSENLELIVNNVIEDVEESQTVNDDEIEVIEGQKTEAIENLEVEEDSARIDSQTEITTYAEENEVLVSTWAEFKAAYNDADVTKITLINDIAPPTSTLITSERLKDRRTSIEIDGQGHTLGMRSGHSLAVNTPSNSAETPLFHIHDIHLGAVGSSFPAYGMDIEGSWSFIAGYGILTTNTNKWEFRLGNITNDPQVARILRAYRAEITLYGHLDLITKAENFYAGSVVIEPGTVYFGNVTYYDYSVIWYQTRPSSGDTGAANVFDVGEGSTVRLSNNTNGATYPAIFDYYKDMIIGENAKFYASMAGNAVRFDHTVSSVGSTFTAKAGSVVNLTSRRTSGYATVRFSTNNSKFSVEPGASVYIVGATSTPTIELNVALRTGNEFILDNPKQYDIRNRGSGYAVNLSSGNGISIYDSDIDLWNTGTDILGPSSATYPQVEYLTANGASSSQKVTSSIDELQTNFRTNKYRRIAGMNTSPEVIFSEITDADLSVTTRVKIGTTPDDTGADEYGNINFIDVFASLNQSQVSLTSSNNSISYADLHTDANGYVIYGFSDYLKAGTTLSANAVRGGWIGEESSIVVKDVTPPEPAIIDGEVRTGQTSIKGKDGEPGAIVTYTINGVDAKDNEGNIISTFVNENGTWEISVPSSGLKADDVLQIFLMDAEGNKNPTVDTDYRDATFKAATTVTILDGKLAFADVLDQISFGTLPISSIDKLYPIISINHALSILDTRAVKSTWTVSAVLLQELYNAEYDSTLSLVYLKDGNVSELSTAEIPIETRINTDDEAYSISDTWYGECESGLYIEAKAGESRVGDYTGTIKWILKDVPGND